MKADGFCGHVDGMETQVRTVLVPFPDGVKRFFADLHVRCVIPTCRAVYTFKGVSVAAPGTVDTEKPSLLPNHTLALPLERVP